MVERYVVMLPFAFHFRWYESHLSLFSISSWNHSVDRWSDAFDDNLVQENEYFRKCKLFNDYQNNPLKVAEEALKAMIYKGYCQPDEEVDCRHVALLPIKVSEAGDWTVKPVIIDLARLISIQEDEMDETFKRQLEILRHSLPNGSN